MRPANYSATSRRTVLRGIAAGIASAALPPFARVASAAQSIAAMPVAAGLTLLGGAGGNILVLATDAGQVVVDSGAAAARDAVLAALGALPGGKVHTVINTHWHHDQVGGNEALATTGATIIAHDKTRLRLKAGWYVPAEDRYEKPLPAAALPTQTFYTSDAATIGGARVEYGYLLEAHTDGDLYVRFPDSNVIAVGDAVSPQIDPVLDWFGGGWLGARVDALKILLELGDASTKFVPSYGPVIGRREVQAEHDALLMLFERMVEHVRLGETPDDMLGAGVMDGLGRTFADPHRFLYDANKGFWAHHNKLMPDIL